MAKVLKFPAIVFIGNLWENYKREQDELASKKLNFLYQEAYKNFYEQFLIMHSFRIGNDVDLHPSLYAKADAEVKAREVVLHVAENGRLNQCYRARVEELGKGKI